jgi:hypothetical protein
VALFFLHAFLSVAACRELDLAGKCSILQTLDAVFYRRCIGTQRVQAGAIGDDIHIYVLTLAFTGRLEAAGIAISMDGRGRFMDNIFIERLWRSIKYEEVHLKAYADGREARDGIGSWMNFYNRASEHPSVYVVEEKRLC